MASPIHEYTIGEYGSIEVKKNKKDYHVIFIPPKEALPRNYKSDEIYKRLIAKMDLRKTVFTFFPFKGRGLYAMEPKYYTLNTITVEIQSYSPNELDVAEVEDIFTMLPDVFIENYNYGLGFLKKYNQIASFIESISIKHLFIKKRELTSYDKKSQTMIINEGDLRTIQKAIDRVSNRASKVATLTKRDVVEEIMLEFIGKSLGHAVEVSKTNVKERISAIVLSPLTEISPQKQDEAVEIVIANSRRMAQEAPSKLVKLRKDIDLVTLDELNKKFEQMLEQDLAEFRWQRLFEENPFILTMAFGVPIVKVSGLVYVGGRKITGGGDKIADFLVRNSMSNNAAIIEIKKPMTKLLGQTGYREDVFAPSSELSGATNQLLDQIYRFQKNIASLKDESDIKNIETYSVLGVLIIGRSISAQNERKSFELFRGNSKNIVIITFDELLEKLKQLRIFLGEDDDYFQSAETDEDLPF